MVSSSPERSVLLLGFQPFGGLDRNVSGEAVERFAALSPRARGVRIAARVLPVSFELAGPALSESIAEHRPSAALAVGIAPDRSFRLERRARNRDAAPVADTRGVVRSGAPIVPGAPKWLRPSVRLDGLAERLQAAGFPWTWSDDAGGFLCNHVFYRLLHLARRGGSDLRLAAFVHVPADLAATDPGRDAVELACGRDAYRGTVACLLRAISWSLDAALDALARCEGGVAAGGSRAG